MFVPCTQPRTRRAAWSLAIGAGLVAAAGSGCGRIGFSDRDGGDGAGGDGAGGDGAGGDGAQPSSWAIGTTSCESAPSALVLDRGVAAGESLVVAWLMREPESAEVAIAGATATWAPDVQFRTVDSTNRRLISVFRTVPTAPIAAGTTLTLAHPSATSWGGIALAVPGAIEPAAAPVLTEGPSAGFSASLETTAPASLCAVAHPNHLTATFAPGWNLVASLLPDCGGTRESSGIHIAVRVGAGAVTCEGTLSSNLSWAVATIGYVGLTAP